MRVSNRYVPRLGSLSTELRTWLHPILAVTHLEDDVRELAGMIYLPRAERMPKPMQTMTYLRSIKSLEVCQFLLMVLGGSCLLVSCATPPAPRLPGWGV